LSLRGQGRALPEILLISRVDQVISSLAQCIFVNTPPYLSNCWFSDRERTLATTLAVNANTLGIAGAYALGSAIVNRPEDIQTLMWVVFLMLIVTLALTCTMPVKPATPPSRSTELKENEGLIVCPNTF